MNALFFTQGRSLQMFFGLMEVLRDRHGLREAGFYIADADNYRQFASAHDLRPYPLVCEWNIVNDAPAAARDLSRLRRYEAAGAGPLLRAAVADRRLYYGPLCTLRQDYRRRFDDQRLLAILDHGLEAIERLFDRVQPDVVFSFICVTAGEYLGQLVAAERGIRVLNLRPTRIDNYITLAPSIFEPSEFVRCELGRPRRAGEPAAEAAARLLEAAQRGATKYEGVIPVSRRPPAAAPVAGRALAGAAGLLRQEWAYRRGRPDNHAVSPLALLLHKRLLNPIQARRVDAGLRAAYVRTETLPRLDYAFFPLHTEPEVTLLVHSPVYLNQIEVARAFSHSLPVGCQLLIKEHPASIGKRPLSYYRKLLQIPNVRLADPAIESRALIEGSRLVLTIAGSIGFEAALRRRPVVTLGRTAYELLPRSMVRRVSLDAAAAEIADLLSTYAYDDEAMRQYLTATIRCSAPINLYSTLLARQGVHVPAADAGWEAQLAELAALAVRLMPGVPSQAAADLVAG